MDTMIAIATAAPSIVEAAGVNPVLANDLFGGFNEGARQLQTTVGIVVSAVATIVFLYFAAKRGWGIGAIVGGLFVGAVLVVGSALGGVSLVGQVIMATLQSIF